jgi:hypothetical protein
MTYEGKYPYVHMYGCTFGFKAYKNHGTELWYGQVVHSVSKKETERESEFCLRNICDTRHNTKEHCQHLTFLFIWFQ